MKKILVVEDNNAYRQSLVRILKENHYLVDDVENALDGIDYFSKKNYDLVISDLMMDEINGLTFLKAIKKMNPKIKTIILTAEPSDVTELEALDLEVDQYLVKSGKMKTELLLKYIKNILKHQEKNKQVVEQLVSNAEKIVMDLDSRVVMKDTEQLDITRKEFEILRYFLENKGKVITRSEFMSTIWEPGEVEERAIDVHVKKIRAKFNIFSIVAVRGIGYKWNE